MERGEAGALFDAELRDFASAMVADGMDRRTADYLSRALQGLPTERQLEIGRVALNLDVRPDEPQWVLLLAAGHVARFTDGLASALAASADQASRRLDAGVSLRVGTLSEMDEKIAGLIEHSASAMERVSRIHEIFEASGLRYEETARRHAENLQAVVGTVVVQKLGEEYSKAISRAVSEYERRTESFLSKSEDDRVKNVVKLTAAVDETVKKIPAAVSKGVLEGARRFEAERTRENPRFKVIAFAAAAAFAMSVAVAGAFGYWAGKTAGDAQARLEFQAGKAAAFLAPRR